MKLKKVGAMALAAALMAGTAIPASMAAENTPEVTADSNTEENEFLIIENNVVTGVTEAGQAATEIEIPEGVTEIGEYAFADCGCLTNVTIPNSVTSIGGYAFYGCTFLTSVTIPDSVTDFSFDSFDESVKLTYKQKQYCSDDLYCIIIEKCTYDENGLCIKDNEVVDCLNDVEQVVIPTGVTSIGWGAFSKCASLTSVTIPDSVTSIDGCAFEHCTSLTSVTIPAGVTSIGDSAFLYCDSLTSVTIPDGVTEFGDNAFGYSVKLTYKQKQYRAEDLYYIITQKRTYDENGLYIKNNEVVDSLNIVEQVVIPNGVTSISNNAFYYCESLTGVTIPNSVTSIGVGAFMECKNLASITIPDSVTYIGDKAFCICKSLTSVTIPNSVTSISDETFSFCENLTSVTIPNSVTSIGEDAFMECTSLKDIYYGGTEEQWKALEYDAGDVTVHFESSSDTRPYRDLELTGIPCMPDTDISEDSFTVSYTINGKTDTSLLYDGDTLKVIIKPAAGYVIEKAYTGGKGWEDVYNPNAEGIVEAEFVAEYLGETAGVQAGSLYSHGLYVITHAVEESSTDSESSDVESSDVESSDVESSDVESSDVESSDVESSDVESSDVESSDVESSDVESSDVESSDVESSDVESSDVESSDVESSDVESSDVESSDVESSDVESSDVESSDVESSDTESSDKPIELKDNTTNISVSGDKEVIPDGAALSVAAVPDKTDANNFTYEISLKKDGKEVQPNGNVTVKLPVPEVLKGKTLYVYRVEDGKYTDMNAKVENGFVVFVTDHFSEYILTAEKHEKAPEAGSPDTGAAGIYLTLGVIALAGASVIAVRKKKQ